jgi:GNAT superfamily N-acetyltransferase
MVTDIFTNPAELKGLNKWSKYKEHLLSLDDQSLCCRFGYAINEASMDQFIEKCKAEDDKHHLFTIRDLEGTIVAVAHVGLMEEGAEVGLSVVPESQHHGLGNKILLHSLRWCQNRGYNWVYMYCLSYNTKMVRMLAKNNIAIVREGSDAEAKIHLPDPTPASVTEEWFVNQLALVDRMYIRNQQVLDACKRMWTPLDNKSINSVQLEHGNS